MVKTSCEYSFNGKQKSNRIINGHDSIISVDYYKNVSLIINERHINVKRL